MELRSFFAGNLADSLNFSQAAFSRYWVKTADSSRYGNAGYLFAPAKLQLRGVRTCVNLRLVANEWRAIVQQSDLAG
jgi:hypothetical protein